MMDWDKDGILGKEDLRATWDKVGKLVTDPELEAMLSEASGPVNFTQLLTLFAARMSDGGSCAVCFFFNYILCSIINYCLVYIYQVKPTTTRQLSLPSSHSTLVVKSIARSKYTQIL